MPLPDFDTLKRVDTPDFDTLRPVTKTGTNPPASPSHDEETDSSVTPDPIPSNRPAVNIKLNPYEESFLKTGLRDPERAGEGALTAELSQHLASDVSNLARGITADIAAGFRALGTGAKEASEFSGNIVAALQREPLPIDKVLKDISGEAPATATIGKISQGIAATAPMLALGALPKALQTAALIGFTGKMISDAPEVARGLGDELGKPKDQQDPDKISSLVSEAIQITGFSIAGGFAMGTKLGAKLGTDPALAAKSEAIKPVAPLTAQAVKEVAATPIPAETPKEKGSTDALKPKTAQSVRDVQSQSGEVKGEVSTPKRSVPADERGSETPATQTPSKIVAAAYKPGDGPPETGANHPAILNRLGIQDFPTRESRNTPQFGFVDEEGKFLTRPEAAERAKATGQQMEAFDVDDQGVEQAHSNEIASTTEPGKPIALAAPVEPPKSISELSDDQILALAEDAGIKASAKSLKAESQRKSIVVRLQELSDKGLLDRRAIEKVSLEPASPQSVAGKEGETAGAEAKAGVEKKLPSPGESGNVSPAVPETITGGSGAERTTQERTGSAIPAEERLSSRSAADISQDLKEAKSKDRVLGKQIDSLTKLGESKKSSVLQSERSENQKRIADLEKESADKRAELTRKRLDRGARVSRSEQERPWDLIDELEGALGGHISLKAARKLIEDFKPIGAARKIFAQEGYAPDVAHQSVSGFKDYGSDVAFLEALNETGTARKRWREKFYQNEKVVKEEESQLRAFTRDAKHPGPASDVILPETLFPGDEITVYGTKMKVKTFSFDDNGDVSSVELEDGKKYGTQHVAAGTKLFIDEKTLKRTEAKTDFAAKESTPPKLRPGEKAGEMFQGEDQPFNLSGEKGIDVERIASEKAVAEKQRLEAAELAAKQQQTLPGTEDLPLKGMGAALLGEVDKPNDSVISNMFAAIDRDRAAMDKPPMPDTQRRSWDEDNTRALNKMNRDPDWIPDLIKEVLKRPRPLLSWENAGLVWQRQKWTAELNNALQRISTAYEGGVDESLAEAKIDAARFEDNLEELDRAVGRSGTGSEAGRTLQAQKMGAGEDFTLIEMRLKKRAAVGGRPLTDTESAEIERLHKELDEAKKKHDTEIASRDQRLSEMANKLEVERLARESKREPAVPPHIKIIADQVKAYFDKRADAAQKRLAGKLFTISPQVLADLTDLGISKILSGAIEFGEWSVKMAEALGEKVKPHLKTVWESSQSALNEHIVKIAGEGVKGDRVKRAVRGTDLQSEQERVTQNIKSRMDSGKKNEITSLVQHLARVFVEKGVKERDPLIDAVHGVLKEIDPEFTRRETMDAISGYGDFRQLSKDTISKELRDLKGQMQQVAKLEDMQAGQAPLKTGVERRIPSKEESRLIKLVNDAKRQFQIPISDPNTQLRSPLDTLKKRMQTRIDELNQKIADKDYRPKQKREIVLDEAAMQSKVALDRIVKKYREGLLADRLANRTPWEKALDWVTKYRRFGVLSSPIVIPKLISAGAQRLASVLPEDIAGEIWSRVPGVSKVAEKAPLEGGGVNLKAAMKGFGAAFSQGIKDAYDVIKTGHSDLDVLYGKAAESYTGESEMGSAILAFPGRLHGMIKAPVKRARFVDAAQRLGEYYANQGLNVADPMVQMRIGLDAYKAAQRSIFLQDNRVASAFSAGLRRLEQPDKATGKPGVGGKALAVTGRTIFPIVRVPLNIVAETFQYAAGLGTGGTRLVVALAKGVEKLTPEQADLIMRELKKGSIGGALLITGYFTADSIGGYYQPGHKKKEGDLKWGSIRVFGHDVPSYLLHNPLLETLQIGATLRHVADSKLRKKDSEAQGLTAGSIAAAIGVVEQVPFVREQLEIQKAMNPYTRHQWFGEQVKSIAVPAVVQKAAEWTDREKKRKPTTVIDHIKSGIPILREQLPTK